MAKRLGRKCAVISCGNCSGKTTNVSFHRFPPDPALKKAWENQCGKLPSLNAAKSYVCSRHFWEKDYEGCLQGELLNIKTRRTLKKGAIPSRDVPGNMSDSSINSGHEKLKSLSPRSKSNKRKEIIEEILLLAPSSADVLTSPQPKNVPDISETDPLDVEKDILKKEIEELKQKLAGKEMENCILKKSLQNAAEDQIKLIFTPNELSFLKNYV